MHEIKNFSYVDGNFFPSYAATIGIDFKVKDLMIDGNALEPNMVLKFWLFLKTFKIELYFSG